MQANEQTEELKGLFATTMSAFSKTGQVDSDLLYYSKEALQLALSFFPDRQIAFQIALDAALGVKHAAYKKSRYRRYYKAQKTTRIALEKIRMFQRMIEHECQKWEKYQEIDFLVRYLSLCDRQTREEFEAKRRLTLEEFEQKLQLNEICLDARLFELAERLQFLDFNRFDLIARYTKLLVQYSLENNSSYAAFAICCLVYDYTIPQVIDICAFLNPDSETTQHFYKLKNKFLSRIKERFGPFINIADDTAGRGFEIEVAPDRESASVVNGARLMLVPWKSECLATDSPSNTSSVDERLYQALEKLPAEDEKELSRIHLVICPDCYTKVIAGCRVKGRSTNQALVLSPPSLAIPLFEIPLEITKGRNNRMIKRRSIEAANAVEREAESVHYEPAALFKVSGSSPQIVILVDGEQKAVLNPMESRVARLTLDEYAGLIKVALRKDRELVTLATFLLNRRELESSLLYRLFGWRQRYSTTLEDGQEVTFTVGFSQQSEGRGVYSIEVRYRDLSSTPALSSLKIVKSRLTEILNRQHHLLLGPAKILAFTIAAICLCGLLYFVFFKQPSQKDLVKKEEPVSSPDKPENSPVQSGGQVDKPKSQPGPVINRPSAPDLITVKPETVQEKAPLHKSNGRREDAKTMSSSLPAEQELANVKRIYIEPFGEDSAEQEFRELLIKKLRESFDISPRKSTADAVVQGSVKQASGGYVIRVVMVNRAGKPIFQIGPVGYLSPAEATDRIVKEMLAKKN